MDGRIAGQRGLPGAARLAALGGDEMMRPRWRKVLTDLWINRLRSLLVVASITIGLFAIGTIYTIFLVVSADTRAGYFAANPPNIYVRASLFDEDLVKRVERLQGVRQAQGFRALSLRVKTGEGQVGTSGEWSTINIEALPNPGKRQIGLLGLEQGAWPPGRREIAVERYKFPEIHAALGEEITLELPSGRTRQVRLAGVVNDQTLGAFSFAAGFFMAPIQGYIDQDTLEWLEQPRPELFNALYVTVEGDSRDATYVKAVSERVRNEMEDSGLTIISLATRDSYNHPNSIYGDALVGLLLVLGFLVLFLSGFLITNTLQALVNQQMQQIGIMKSLGARRRQVLGVYMMLVVAFSLVSVAISVPLTYGIAFEIIANLATQINSIFQGRRVLPQVILLQVGMGLLVPQLAAFVPISQGTLLTIQEALSGIRQNVLPSQDWLSRWITRWKLLSRPTRLALRNTLRRKGRLALTLITLSLGGAVFISTFNVQLSMADYVTRISRYFLADINLTLTKPYRIERIQNELAGVPGIDYIEGWAAASCELILDDDQAGEAVILLAPPADSRLVQPLMLEGRWIQPGDENVVVLNERFLSEFPEIHVGDTLKLRVNGDETDWDVIGFFQMAGKSGSFLSYASYDYLSKLIDQPFQASTFRIVGDHPGMSQAEQTALGQRIEERLRREGIDIGEIQVGQWLSETASRGFAVLTGFLLFLAVLTAAVGGIGLAGTMSMNVMERTREIGVMRAIGASNRMLMRMVLIEGGAIGVLSWVIACGLAFPISKAMSDQVSQALFGFSSGFVVTPNGFLLWLGIVLVLSAAASFLPARNAARLTIREVLAYE
ncbi:MAG: ABC transporter permease [Chloroflexota bacterium]